MTNLPQSWRPDHDDQHRQLPTRLELVSAAVRPAPDRGIPRQPRRLQTRQVEVRSVLYDGNPDTITAIADWVSGISPGAEVAATADGTLTVSIDRGQLKLRPGQHLLLERRGTRWLACETALLDAWFEPLVRELPIFDDGEVSGS